MDFTLEAYGDFLSTADALMNLLNAVEASHALLLKHKASPKFVMDLKDQNEMLVGAWRSAYELSVCFYGDQSAMFSKLTILSKELKLELDKEFSKHKHTLKVSFRM